jgi:hypothetical protein
MDAAMRAILYRSALVLLTRSKEYSGIRVGGSELRSAAAFAERPAVARKRGRLRQLSR